MKKFNKVCACFFSYIAIRELCLLCQPFSYNDFYINENIDIKLKNTKADNLRN